MPLERDYVLLYGPTVRVENGVKHRDKVLQPCGCWTAQVWREVEFQGALRKQWCLETRQCDVHSAAAVVAQLQIGQEMARRGQQPNAMTLGDGAERLLADADRVLAARVALDQELKELCAPDTLPIKQTSR